MNAQSLNLNRGKFFMGLSVLAMTLVMSAMVNSRTFKSNVSADDYLYSGARSPASELAPSISSRRSFHSSVVQRSVASEIATMKDRKSAQMAHPAKLDENLRFGVFEGKYAFNLQQGFIRTIALRDQASPIKLGDPESFLKKYAFLFDLSEFHKLSVTHQAGGKVLQTYRAKSNSSGRDLVLQFTLDSEGNVLTVQTDEAAGA